MKVFQGKPPLFFTSLAAGVLTLALGIGTAPAQAATLTSSGLAEYTLNNFVNPITSQNISIQKFDPGLGTLNSVEISFIANILGNGGFENRSSRAVTVTVNFSSDFTLALPNAANLLIQPSQSYTYNVARFDGSPDYAGSSGRTISGLQATATTTNSYNDSSLLQAFSGIGNIDLLLSPTDTSTVTGSGSIISFFDTTANSTVTVTYDYTSSTSQIPVPVPAPTPALLPGLIGLSIAKLGNRFIKRNIF